MVKWLDRILLFLLIALVVIGSFYGALSLGMKPLVNHEINSAVAKTRGRAFELRYLGYGSVDWGLTGISFKNIYAHGLVRYDFPNFDPRHFDIAIPIFEVRLGRDQNRKLCLTLEAKGATVDGKDVLPGVREETKRLEGIHDFNFRVAIPLSGMPWQWKSLIVKKYREFRVWVFQNGQVEDVQLKGNAIFLADGLKVNVYFFSQQNSAGKVHVEGARDDLRLIAQIIEPKFTDSDVEIAARNLLRTPRLLKIRTQAEQNAKELSGQHPAVAYDVPRHIFWSYWLTRAFGPAFAREVTNAHEINDPKNTPAESDKDRHHNALGIEYALNHLSETEVQKKILQDPRVIRAARVSRAA